MRTLSILLVALLAGCEQTALSQEAGTAPLAVDAPLAEGAGALERVDGEIASSRRTAITRAVEAASPAVVSVNVIELRRYVQRANPLEEFFYGQRIPDRVVEQEVKGLGSGFVVSPDGYIVTNDHVAGDAAKITVALADGRQLPARLVGSDPQTDTALLKVDPPEPLPYLAFEDRGDPIVGEWAVALGNPFGLFEAAEPTVTVGVVSAVGREVTVPDGRGGRTFRDLVQTDAAINSGNSGGPLVNALGRVIGMNTFIFSRSGGSVGLGFAIPAWRVRQVVAELQASGSVNRAVYTGLSVNTVTPRIAQALGLSEARGVVVRSVDAGSPAEAAGLRPYDVVRSIGGEPVASNQDVGARLFDLRAGDSVRLGVVRNGEPVEVTLRLARAE